MIEYSVLIATFVNIAYRSEQKLEIMPLEYEYLLVPLRTCKGWRAGT